jgi:MFS family permease
MFFLFRTKQEPTSRSYDIAASGFSPLPLKSNISEDQSFRWNFGLVKDFAAIFFALFISAIGYGILMVMIAIKLEANIKNEILMSVSTATQIGAGVIFSRFLPSLGRKSGMINSIYIGSAISAICSILLYWYVGYLFWLVVIFFLGISFFISGVTRNTIVIDLAPTHIRPIIVSIGMMLVAIGNSLGPVVIKIFQTSDSFASFALASALFLASTAPLKRLKRIDSVVREEKSISVWRYIKNSPKIMIAAFSTSFAGSACSSFLIIYGLKINMPQDEASLLLSVLLLGTVFYIPFGYLANILNRRFMMIFFAALSLILSITLVFTTNTQHIPILLFLLFGFLAGIKLPAILLINEKYKPTQRLAVNSAFSRFSLIGNICGIFTVGILMKIIGPKGLWVAIIIILIFFLVFCCFNYAKKLARKELSFKDFSILYKHQNEQMSDA